MNVPFVGRFIAEDETFAPNDVLEEAAGAMLDELGRTEAALRPLREPQPARG